MADMAIFRFFKTAAVHHLGFVGHIFGPPTKSTWRSVTGQILVGIHLVVFTRDAMLSMVYAVIVCLSVCLCVCVCVSVTLRYCIKTAKRRIMQIMPDDSTGTLVFWHQSSRRNSNGITPYGGDKCRWGGLKFVTFDEKHAITRKWYKIEA